MSREPSLRLPTQLAPWNCILGSWFGSNFENCFGSIFGLGPALGPHDFSFNSLGTKTVSKKWTLNKAQNWTQIKTPKTQSRGANCVGRRRQGSCRHDLQSVVCSAIFFNCLQQTKNFNERTKRKLGPANLLKRTACVRLQAKHSQDMTPLQKIHSAVSHMGKSTTACSLQYYNYGKCCGKWTFIVLLCCIDLLMKMVWFSTGMLVYQKVNSGFVNDNDAIKVQNSCDVIFDEFFGFVWRVCCGQLINGHFRILNWRYLPYIRPILGSWNSHWIDGFPVFQASQAQPSKAMPMIAPAAPSVCQPRALRVWWALAAPKVPGLAAAWWNSWCPGWTRWLYRVLKYVI